MSLNVGLLDHYNVSTRNLKDTVKFYEDVLGFVNGPRPAFNFPGLALQLRPSRAAPQRHFGDRQTAAP
jgi:catechol 2,3-dioxygenase-like lactoylglutathione lyase family enzyme